MGSDPVPTTYTHRGHGDSDVGRSSTLRAAKELIDIAIDDTGELVEVATGVIRRREHE
jgi:hypothetical protein